MWGGGSAENLHYDANKKQVYIIYKWSDSGTVKMVWREITTTAGSSSGSLGTAYTVQTGTSESNFFLKRHTDSNRQAVAFGDDSSNIRIVTLTHTSTNMTDSNFLGFSDGAYTSGQTATIKVTGNTVTKSSLTPGSKYYVQMDGSVGTTAVDPSVTAGLALTSTSLLIRGD